MPIRVGFDLDGVVADFASAYYDVERRLFGDAVRGRSDDPEREEAEREASDETRRRRDAIWQEIRQTADFWASLQPVEANGVRRIHDLMLRHRWEVFFITRRPATVGDTVQRQSQRWLSAQGFDLPSVVVAGGSHGVVASALRLWYYVDDSARNCIDVKSGSEARPLLIVPEDDPAIVESARKLGIGVAVSLSSCLDMLDGGSGELNSRWSLVASR